MSENFIYVTDKDGWTKQFAIKRNLLHLGSSPHNDVVLEPSRGGGVSPRHIQILPNPSTGKYRVVNLSQADVDADGQALPPRAFIDFDTGRTLHVGEFKVQIQGEAKALTPTARTRQSSNGNVKSSDKIGAQLALSHRQLTPDMVIEASLLIMNLGDQGNVQFQIGVEGLPEDSIEIGPGPILFAGAEKRVPIEISHPKSPETLAGPLRLRVYISAPESYPGELTVITESLEVMEYLDHDVVLKEL